MGRLGKRLLLSCGERSGSFQGVCRKQPPRGGRGGEGSGGRWEEEMEVFCLKQPERWWWLTLGSPSSQHVDAQTGWLRKAEWRKYLEDWPSSRGPQLWCRPWFHKERATSIRSWKDPGTQRGQSGSHDCRGVTRDPNVPLLPLAYLLWWSYWRTTNSVCLQRQ